MVLLADSTNSNIAGVDHTLRALIVSQCPMECLNWSSYGMKTSIGNGVGSCPVFSLRYTGPNYLVIRRLGVGAISSSGAANFLNTFDAYIARSFIAADSGGTVITTTGNSNKHRTSMAAVTAMSITCGFLTAGTRTLDAQQFGSAQFCTAGAGTAFMPITLDNLLTHNEGDYPIILNSYEGIVINNLGGSSGGGYSWGAYFNIELAEVVGF
jgi:hypothetical protein